MLELMLAFGFAVFISAGCSLFEAVLYSVPRRHIETGVHSGKKGWKVFRSMREDIEKPIAAVLSLNTIANTAGAAVAGAAATAALGHEWLGYFSAFFTLTVLVFSEIIPKTAGVVYSKSLGAIVAYPLKWLVWIMLPAIWLSSLITGLIARGKSQDAITAQELRVMARMSLRTGEIKAYQEQAIGRILTLQDKLTKDVMTPRTVVFALSEHLTLEEACRVRTDWEHSRFPVYDRDFEDVVGIVLTRELFIALADGKRDMTLTELMRPVHFVVETAKLNQVLMEFLELRQHLFVVLDEYGGLAGLIALEDILEEILGREIVDESDQVADKRELARRRRSRLTAKSAKQRNEPSTPDGA
jgi:CBS domain containing-hemolysin-like protein